MALDKVKDDMLQDNIELPGSNVKVPVHANTSARDSAISSPANGMIIYNTAETALQQYNGTWSTIAPAPTITSISGTINEDTNTTLTVNGSQYISGMTVKLVLASNGSDISGHNSLSYTLVSSAQITVTIPSATSNITPGAVVQLEIIKSGLSVKSQSITVSEDPNWTTNAGTVATIDHTLGASQTVATLAATAGAGGGTLNYASDDNTLDTTYFALNLTSGVITTTSTALTGLTGSGNYTESFNANAKISGDSLKNTVRAFNIIVNATPIGGTIINNSGNTFRYHKFTTAGTNTFQLWNSKTIDIFIVAGGAGGGLLEAGGGGAGEVVWKTGLSLSAGTYNAVVGAGGVGTNKTSSSPGRAASGTDSTFALGVSGKEVKAKGGGAGGRNGSGEQAGLSGGSGGGSSRDGGQSSGAAASKYGTGSASDQQGIGYASAGGYTPGTAWASASGGGGAGGAGGNGSGNGPGSNGDNASAGAGGVGIRGSDIHSDVTALMTDTSIGVEHSGVRYIAGGGGGSCAHTGSAGSLTAGAGGYGGGGAGALDSNTGTGVMSTAGTPNTGGGGGGGLRGATGVNGGSGIIVIRYAI